MISAEEARQLQHNVKVQKEQAQIEFDAKYTYIDENGKKQYYSLESFDDIMRKIEECCDSNSNTTVSVRNKLHPDTVKKLKEAGYRVFLSRYETHDFRQNMNKYGKHIYEPITYHWIDTCISWSGVPYCCVGETEEI